MPFRVLFVDHTAQLGGAELSLLSAAKAFRATGHTVLFEPGPFLERLHASGLSASVLPAPAFLQDVRREGGVGAALASVPGLLRLAARLARRARAFDVLLANSQKAMLVAGLAGRLARRPVVWCLRDLLTAAHFGRLNRGVAAAASRLLVDRTVANSNATRDALVAAGGAPGRIEVVHNGIDAGPFLAVTEADVAALRRELALPPAGVVGVFSRLAAWKGQHVLLDALEALPGATALLVGDALFPEDERYADRLRQTIRRRGLVGRVRMPGFRADVPALMRACDIVLHTSTAPEPFGRVVVEGMLAGRPVVATDRGGPAEILAGSSAGLLVPAGDADALAAALGRLLARPGQARAMGAAGRARARSRFSVEQMVDGLERALAAAAGRPAPPPRSDAPSRLPTRSSLVP